MPRWTKPYHGVTHLQDLRAGFQVTVQTHRNFALAQVKIPVTGWMPDQTFDTAAEAQAHGEERARALYAFERTQEHT